MNRCIVILLGLSPVALAMMFYSLVRLGQANQERIAQERREKIVREIDPTSLLGP